MNDCRSCVAEVLLTLPLLDVEPVLELPATLEDAFAPSNWASALCAPEMAPIILPTPAIACRTGEPVPPPAARLRQSPAAPAAPPGALDRYNPLIRLIRRFTPIK
jgi:hypothetical protein